MTYAVETFETAPDGFPTVLAALETQMELVNSSKTIHYIDIVPHGGNFKGVLIYDT